ncbi:hypothetical protein SCLCIDRAFT_27184 [Scleroderma citrinum Foug A]|uniref:Uncharacterized protein n=1 Tax=Scleroderma citrinum Foug A TaxID=1036808 RepID=A0A0C2ZCY4_9AGAM|nr:hypothetical protein SCLCIDRAFT_27184 [Scleroderma citrinum Foug A]
MQFQRGLTCWGDRSDPGTTQWTPSHNQGRMKGNTTASASTIGAAPGTGLAIPDPSQSKTSLLSPTPSDVAKEKNNRWYKVTIMIEPFSCTMNWKGKTPTGETPAKASLATTPITTTTMTSATMGAALLPAQAHRQTAIFPSMGGKDAHSSSDSISQG